MTAAAEVLDQARRALGTKETPAGSNKTPFGKQYGTNGVAWCAIFVWCCFANAGASGLIAKAAYTPTLADWFRNRGQWGDQPRPGALAFFDWADDVHRIQHVGLVEAVRSDGTIVTIEGNTSAGTKGSQSDGDGVYRRTRSTVPIVGYGYPEYDDGPRRTATVAPDDALVRGTQAAVHVAIDGRWGKGTDGAVVAVRQAAFLGQLVDVGKTQAAVGTKVDNDWGQASKRALTETVAELQGVWGGLKTDGAWGKATDARFQDVRTASFRP